MKIQHIKYVMEIYRTGSISKAAKNLYLSQPNISNAIKNLEEELGFAIFTRSNNGITFTEKGVAFVEHARSINAHLDKIAELSSQESSRRFAVVNPNYAPVEYAFVRLCGEFHESSNLKLKIVNSSSQDVAIDLVYRRDCDMALVISNDIFTAVVKQELEKKNLRYQQLSTLGCNVCLSEDHPLLGAEKFELSGLWDYPIVHYINAAGRGSTAFSYGIALGFVNPDRVICVDSWEERNLVLATTNAYSISAQLPTQRFYEKLTTVSLPDTTLSYGYIVSADQELGETGTRFLELLEAESNYLGDPPMPEA